jgi:spermidine/putrescine-binding protein
MSTSKFIDDLAKGMLSRREVNKGLSALGIGMLTMPMMSSKARAASEIMYFGWAGHDDPAFYESYTEKYGGVPDFTFWGSEDEAFTKMRMGGFVPDIMAPCTYELVKWHDAGLLQPLDTAKLDHVGDMFPTLDNIEGSIINGQRHFMPMDWGNSTVVYRTDLVDPKYNEEHSWEIMFDERYKNRLGYYDSAGAVIEIAALVMGYENIFSLTDEQLLKVREKIIAQRNILRFYWSDNTEADQALASGEIVASYAWNASYVRLKADGIPVGMMVPKEGIFTWCRSLVMHKESKDVEASYAAINAMTSPEAGAYEIANWGYGHANKKAFDLVSPEKLDELGLSTPESLLNGGIFFQALDSAIEEKYIRLFEEVKAGV